MRFLSSCSGGRHNCVSQCLERLSSCESPSLYVTAGQFTQEGLSGQLGSEDVPRSQLYLQTLLLNLTSQELVEDGTGHNLSHVLYFFVVVLVSRLVEPTLVLVQHLHQLG